MSRRNRIDRRRFLFEAGAVAAGAVGLAAPLEVPAADAATSASGSKRTMNSAASKTGLVSAAEYQLHVTGEGHPERPERCRAVLDAVRVGGFDLTQIAPRRATDEELLLCHTPGYLEAAKRDVKAGRDTLSTGDTAICSASLDIALLATGGVLEAVDAVMNSKVRNAFCVLRPPGHHATPDRGMGFCLFNNIAIGARYAQKKHKIGKVLIADWDVHHGNGTQDIFYADGSVFVFNTHQSPWYPGTGDVEERGSGKGRGFILNCPFPSGSGRKEILGAFQDKLVPAAQTFKPELVMISAGFDSRAGDPLGQFRLTDEDFAELTVLLKNIARQFADSRIVSVLEGGYSLSGLGKAVAAHVKALTQA